MTRRSSGNNATSTTASIVTPTRASIATSLAAALLLAACSSGTTGPTPTLAGGGGGTATLAPVGTQGSGGNGGSGGGGNGDVSSIDACALLTPDEIKQALGVAMKPGFAQNTDTQHECQWDSQDDSDAAGVSVSVAQYDDVLWQNMSSSELAKPISGFGDAAFTGFPHAGDIAIKVGGFEVDLGVVDFKLTNDKADAAAQTLATLALTRL